MNKYEWMDWTLTFSLNDGWKGYDDKLFGFGIAVWNNPIEIYFDIAIWTIILRTPLRGIKWTK
jgi:hypothetical protein